MNNCEIKYIAIHTNNDSDIIHTDIGLEWIVIYVNHQKQQ